MGSVFDDIVRQCGGMLSSAAYQRIYEAARTGGLLVEIGTGRGAGTVALALGLKDSGRAGTVISFDSLEDGRDANERQEQMERVRGNLLHFGVEELVTLIPAALPEAMPALPDTMPISLLLLDADGRIDRDLLLLYERLHPGAPLIIGHCAEEVRLSKAGVSTYRIDAGTRLAFLMVQWLEARGLLIDEAQVDETRFLHKPFGPTRALEPLEILEVYRQLVFSTAHLSPFQAIQHQLEHMLGRDRHLQLPAHLP